MIIISFEIKIGKNIIKEIKKEINTKIVQKINLYLNIKKPPFLYWKNYFSILNFNMDPWRVFKTFTSKKVYNVYKVTKILMNKIIKNKSISVKIISPPYCLIIIQHFFKFVYTFFKKYDKLILTICKH